MRKLSALLLFAFAQATEAQSDTDAFLRRWQTTVLREWVLGARICMREGIEAQLMYGNRDVEKIINVILPLCGDHVKRVLDSQGAPGAAFVRALAEQELRRVPELYQSAIRAPGESGRTPQVDQRTATPLKPVPRASGNEASSGGFVVAVGAYAEPDPIRARLVSAQIPHHAETSGSLTRLRAGPFASREAAEQAREKLKALGFAPGPIRNRDAQ